MSSRSPFLAATLSLSILFGLTCSKLLAQDEPGAAPSADAPAPASEDPPAADTPEGEPSGEEPASEEKPAAETPSETDPAEAPAAPAAGGDASAKYQTLLAEWKDSLAKLREIDADYKLAEEAELAGIAERWNEQVAATRAMIAPLRAAAVDAYRAAPGKDRELERFLSQLVIDDAKRDDLEQGYETGKLLLENGVRDDEVFAATGIAAYGVNQYDDAERYLQEAARLATPDSASDRESLTARAVELLATIPDQRKLWEEEQAFRDKEAEADDLPRVKLETTKGPVVIELFENEAPNTVANFVNLVEKGFYDGLTFHRVLPHFVAQGGDPKGDGTGGPGYAIKCEWPNEPNRMHFRGSLSMAHAGRDTGGSQFFLTMLPTPHLNDRHTVFGRIVEGMDVLAALQRIDPEAPTAGKQPDKIVKAEVVRKREHAYEPETIAER